MRIDIIGILDGRVFYESGSHYQPISFKPLEPSSFRRDFRLNVFGSNSEPEIDVLISLNQLRELRDALNKFLPKEI